jgi:hypothetical protein
MFDRRSLAFIPTLSHLIRRNNMAKPLDPIVEEVLNRYGIDPRRALWDCHGTWVIYHKYVELIGMKAGVHLDPPRLIESSAEKKIAVILVEGSLGLGEGAPYAWSYGEATPANNKNAYPFAMAEKRAKDRVIMKLVGLAGHLYTEQDAADIKDGKIQWEVTPSQPKAATDEAAQLADSLRSAETIEALDACAAKIRDADLNAAATTQLRKIYATQRKELQNG